MVNTFATPRPVEDQITPSAQLLVEAKHRDNFWSLKDYSLGHKQSTNRLRALAICADENIVLMQILTVIRNLSVEVLQFLHEFHLCFRLKKIPLFCATIFIYF